MRALVAAGLRFRVLVLAAAAALLVLGGLRLHSVAADTYPQFAPPLVQIQTEALGLSGGEVEQLVTAPLEDLLNGVAWLDTIRSQSIPGLSSIDLVFAPGTNVLRARQLVQERLAQARLPNLGATPTMLQPVSSTSRFLMIGLSSRAMSMTDLSVLARWKIRPRLMGVPGVANVSIYGQRDRRLQVQVDPLRLRRAGVSVDQVLRTTGNALWVSPLSYIQASTPGTGGFLDTPTQRFAVQHILPITTPRSLAAVTVEDTGSRRLRLSDVADVVEDHQPLIGDAVVDDHPGLVLVLDKFPDANTVAVTRAVDSVLRSMRPGLSGITMSTGLYRPANYVTAALHNVSRAGLVGALLLVVLLALCLSWRAAVVVALSCGLALVAAVLVLTARGAALNAMTVAGLALALGVLVDDAVGDVHAVDRGLRARSDTVGRRPSVATVLRATLSARRPALYGSTICLLAALPLLSLPAVAGSFARPLVLSYALAIVAAMLVALLVTPALAATLLPAAGTRRGPLGRRLRSWYDGRLAPWAARPRTALAAAAALAVLGLAAVPFLHDPALPPLRDRSLLVHWQAAPGTSLPEMDRITAAASRAVRAVPGVRAVGAHVGRALTGDTITDVDAAELWVTLRGSADYDRTVAAVRRVLDGYPGIRERMLPYPEDRVAAVSAGTAKGLVVRVYGTDLRVLQGKAEEVRRLLGGVRGVRTPAVERTVSAPAVEVEVRLASAARYGIKPGDVRRAAATLLSGTLVGNLYEQQKVFDVVVWGTSAVRHSVAGVQNLLIDTPRGGLVPLRDLAAVRIRPDATVIRHDATARSLDVTATVAGRPAAAVSADVRSRLARLPMPLEYHAEVLGDVAAGQAQRQRTAVLAVAAGIVALLLLQSAFASWRRAALLLAALPLSLVGGLVVAAAVGAAGSLGAGLGLLLVLGVALRQGIGVFAALAEQERSDAPHADPVRAAARSRVAPVLATALGVAALALPFAATGPAAGLEILHPMALVVLGGLVSSAAVTLLVLPALAARLTRSPGQPAAEAVDQPDRPLTDVS